MNEKILCVDDERNILEGFQRFLRKNFDLDVANSGAEGLEMVANHGPYAVVVSDMRMPEMDGIEFLSAVKQAAPKSVRIMLTGNADQQTAIEAINEGAIFRFLNKPCPPEKLAAALNAGVEQYHLILAETDVLERTLRGAVQLLTEILSIVNPTAFGRATRVSRVAAQITKYLKVNDAWQVEIAAMLSQIGCIAIPQEILRKVYHGYNLDPQELKMVQSHPQKGFDLINCVPRLGPVAEMIAYQEKLFNGAGIPVDSVSGTGIPIGGRILKLALDFDKLLEQKHTPAEAIREIESRLQWYDPELIGALKKSLVGDQGFFEVRNIHVQDIAPGMVIADDVISVKRMMLIRKGTEVNQSLCVRLYSFYESGMINEWVKVRVRVAINSGNGSGKSED